MTLERDEVSAIAHRDHPIACPFSDARVASLLRRLPLPAAARVLDVGCGGGEWLARLLELRSDARATGVDASDAAIAQARERLGCSAELVHAQAETYLETHITAFDAILCNGSTHALGGLADALTRLRNAIAPAGLLLISDGYWQKPPGVAACRALGVDPGDFRSLDATIGLAMSAGYAALDVETSSPDEWDDYERSWCGALSQYVSEQPQLPAADASLINATVQAHRDAYLNGYRGTLGFVALLLRRA